MDDLEHSSDWDLVESCKKRDDDAWRELVKRHQRSVSISIREKLGEKAKDCQLVEDLAQDVFVALIDKRCELLRLYDPKRGCFDTFLKAVVSHVAHAWRRREGARPELKLLPNSKEPVENSGDAGLVRAELAEFWEGVTPQEKRHLGTLMGEAAENPEESSLSAANARQLKHRLEKKADKYFDGR